ncbi:MAG: helix-turn-helix domain-containing protein [Quinella sp. 1Q5]|nr:helix-turn-helix domain-containing protein [Quinella sp. 1Q5]
MSYKHLSITERELLLIYLVQGLSLCQIAQMSSAQVIRKAGVVHVSQKVISRLSVVARTNHRPSQAQKLSNSDKIVPAEPEEVTREESTTDSDLRIIRKRLA